MMLLAGNRHDPPTRLLLEVIEPLMGRRRNGARRKMGKRRREDERRGDLKEI